PRYAKALLRSGDTSYFIMGIAVGHMGEFKRLVRVGRVPDPGVVMKFTYRVASTLQALHAKGLVHADVKLANCLVDAQGEIDLADFDQVRPRAQCATQDGNDFYDAPERQTWAYTPWQSIWPCEEAYIGDSRKSDIFALGVAICELYSEKLAFGRNIDDIRASEQIRQNALAQLLQHSGPMTPDMMKQIIPATTPSLLSRSWTRLMAVLSTPPHILMAPMLLRMLALDIRERPDASELINHIIAIASGVENAPGFIVSNPKWLGSDEADRHLLVAESFDDVTFASTLFHLHLTPKTRMARMIMAHLQSARPIVAVIGTTGVGKSNLAIALAESLKSPYRQGVVLSADSMQIYKGLDVITNKVSKEEMRGVKHWGLDMVYKSAEMWKKHHYFKIFFSHIKATKLTKFHPF
ncbi:MAG: hypothetical protein EOO85_21645, partial [Pedobacter sp.]